MTKTITTTSADQINRIQSKYRGKIVGFEERVIEQKLTDRRLELIYGRKWKSEKRKLRAQRITRHKVMQAEFVVKI